MRGGAVLRWAGGGLAALTVLAVLIAAVPGRRDLVTGIFLLVVAAIAFVAFVNETRAGSRAEAPSELERALRRPPPEPERLPDLERIERAVTLATATDFDAHARLRPVLCEIAEARLAARGIRLDDSVAARAVLGEETWELVRPDRRVARNPNTPGPDAEQLRRVVAVLEGLGP